MVYLITLACLSSLFEPVLSFVELPPWADSTFSADTTQAHRYFSLASDYQEQANYDSALFYYKAAQALFEKSTDDVHLIKCYNQIGNCLWKTGDYAASQQLLEETLRKGKARLGQAHQEVANTYHALGTVNDILGNSDRSLASLQKALTIRRKLFGAQHADVAKSYYEMAVVRFGKGEYQAAMEACMTALTTYVGIEPGSRDVGACYNLLGVLHDNLGEYHQAQESYEQALDIRLEVLSDTHPDVATTYNNLGILHKTKGDYSRALAYFEKALDSRIGAFGEEHPVVATTYNNIGATYTAVGDYEKAILYHTNALSIRQRVFGESHSEVAASYNNLGSPYNELGEYDKALDYYHRALAIDQENFGESHPYLAGDYHNLGIAYKDAQDYDQALQYFKKALRIDRQAYGSDHPHVAKDYLSIGTVHDQKGAYQPALRFLHQALAIYQNKLDSNSVEMGSILAQIGQVYAHQDSIKTALRYYQRAIAALSTGFIEEDIYQNPTLSTTGLPKKELLTSLIRKADLLSTLDTPETRQAANATYGLASDLVTLLRTKYDTDEAKLFLSQQVSGLYDKAIENALQLYERTHNQHYVDEALQLTEKSRSGLLLESLHHLKTQRIARVPDSLVAQEQEFKTDLAFYYRRLDQALGQPEKEQEQLAQIQKDILTLSTQYDHLLADIKQHYPDYYALKYDVPALDISAVQDTCLSANQQLLVYFLGKEHIVVWLIGKDQVDYIKIPKPDTFASSVEGFLNSLKTHDFSAYSDQGHTLFQLLLEPVLAKVHHPQIDHLLIVPDGILGYIPFETLLPEEPTKARGYQDLHYLIQDYQVSYHYSANLLGFRQPPKHQPQQTFIGFAPAFQDDVDQQLLTFDESERAYPDSAAALPFAQEEVNHIATLLKGTAYTGTEATELSFKQRATDYNIVHLASHSLINDADPLYSQFIFDRTNDAEEDGLLHTYELYSMQLNADLVCLSACNTGRGKYYQGEGIMSLARGFMYAGVPNVVMSLWSVADRPTKDIMKYFYEGVHENATYANALHQAKLRYLETADNLTADPYYWGAFIYLGQPTAQTSYSRSGVRWGIALGLVVLLIAGCTFVVRRRILSHQ